MGMSRLESPGLLLHGEALVSESVFTVGGTWEAYHSGASPLCPSF